MGSAMFVLVSLLLGCSCIVAAETQEEMKVNHTCECGIMEGLMDELTSAAWPTVKVATRCRGALINDRWILVAAQCLLRHGYKLHSKRAVLFDHYSSTPRRLTVKRVVNHPYNNFKTGENDVALMELEEPLSLSDVENKPVCLPNANTAFINPDKQSEETETAPVVNKRSDGRFQLLGYQGHNPGKVRIRSGDTIYLNHGNIYLGNPVASKDWPAQRLETHEARKGAHVIWKVYGQKGEPLWNTDLVRIKSVKTTHSGFNALYCSTNGWIYYDKVSDNKKQLWYIKGNPIDGNSILFENRNWPGYYLTFEEGWGSCEEPRQTKWTVTVKEEPAKICNSTGGTKGGPCIFPFTYRDTTYCSCTSARHHEDWCATYVNGKGEYTKWWGTCTNTCEKPSDLCFASRGTKNGQCVFPFIYEGQTYCSCTRKNAAYPWCATEVDENNFHTKWGVCNAECPRETDYEELSVEDTEVSKHLQWIKDTTKDAIYCNGNNF